ncbi:hypothetical protein CKM354_000625000 [Cercospora kikuchii]|uniref:Integral membrane protein n=1 Tax=Cercospora kikuchii TaxID=84275 RepID=A0A9P3FHL4_9PEZI|nr:uncharacterized protein CKM354_000625000 [Cercospora kikuchii]GIZ43004.1 hypothetical protein CKM354_000625000 [Cercospora kikuchii]
MTRGTARLALILAGLAQYSSAAYIQSTPCPGDTTGIWAPWEGHNFTFANVKLAKSSNGTNILSFDLRKLAPENRCDGAPKNVSIVLGTGSTFTSSDMTHHAPQDAQVQCASPWNVAELVVPVTTEIGPILSFSTIQLEVQATLGRPAETFCVAGNAVVAAGSATQRSLRYGPVGVLLFVLLAEVAEVLFGRYVRSNGRRGLWDNARQCLLYLQFVFLFSTLGLNYPTFFQPVVSHLNGPSLLLPGPLRYGTVYSSINDGIYEFNGTYGGTYGIELMHQMVGAPKTMVTWYNMVIAVLIIIIIAAFCLEVSRCWSRHSPATGMHLSRPSNGRLAAISKAMLSCFALPICTLSFYQVHYARKFPVHHTAFALGMIVVVLLSFVWLFTRIRHDSFSAVETPRSQVHIRREELHVLLGFVLTIIRSAAIAWLDSPPLAQLVLLCACEAVSALSDWYFEATTLVSMSSAGFRSVALAPMFAFLPGVTAESTRNIIGCSILALHAAALLFVFCLPCAYRLLAICVCMTREDEQEAPAYGLRQLKRRPNSNLNLLQGSFEEPEQRQLADLTKPTFYRQPSKSRIELLTTTNPDRVSDASSSSLVDAIHVAAVDEEAIDSWNRNDIVALDSRWHDFSFRESDLIYAPRGRQQIFVADASTQHEAAIGGRMSATRKSYQRAVSWLSSRVTKEPKGFQVVRPQLDPRNDFD